MILIEQLVADFRAGLEEERLSAVADFAKSLIDAMSDGLLTDAETETICNTADLLGISHDEWCALREEAYQAAIAAGATGGELNGIRAFLYFAAEE